MIPACLLRRSGPLPRLFELVQGANDSKLHARKGCQLLAPPAFVLCTMIATWGTLLGANLISEALWG